MGTAMQAIIEMILKIAPEVNKVAPVFYMGKTLYLIVELSRPAKNTSKAL
jgi:hypothetical protein